MIHTALDARGEASLSLNCVSYSPERTRVFVHSTMVSPRLLASTSKREVNVQIFMPRLFVSSSQVNPTCCFPMLASHGLA
jgi:hypothetical protein